jgi:dolichol-phosphate mannosyltransferase
MNLDCSVVIPLKDEEANVRPLIEELEEVMNGLDLSWECILVNDGSTDGTEEQILSLQSSRSYIRYIAFDRNYGQSAAFDAGFKYARGNIMVTLDGDLQNDPHDIPRMIKRLKGADLVCGVRVRRKDSLFKRWISKIANFIRRRLLNDHTKDTGCSLKVYRKQSLDQIKLYKGMHRFLPALFAIEGFRITQLEVNHRPRKSGKTKYNIFNRSFNTLSDLFAVYWMSRRKLNYKIKNSPHE